MRAAPKSIDYENLLKHEDKAKKIMLLMGLPPFLIGMVMLWSSFTNTYALQAWGFKHSGEATLIEKMSVRGTKTEGWSFVQWEGIDKTPDATLGSKPDYTLSFKPVLSGFLGADNFYDVRSIYFAVEDTPSHFPFPVTWVRNPISGKIVWTSVNGQAVKSGFEIFDLFFGLIRTIIAIGCCSFPFLGIFSLKKLIAVARKKVETSHSPA